MSSSSTAIPWTRIRALSFDIYGTLIDWETGIASAARATALGPYLPSSHRDLMVDIERHDISVQREHPTWLQTEVIAEGLRRYARELGIVEKLGEAAVDEACREYGCKIGEYPAFADTVVAMQQLGKRFKLIPLSNVDVQSFGSSLEGSLRGVRFDAVYTAQDIGSYKPDPRNFDYLIEHVGKDFGVKPEQLVHVAQSLFHDHRPARAAGLTTVWVDRKGIMGTMGEGTDNAQEQFGYAVKVDTLAELARIVDEAFAREGKA